MSDERADLPHDARSVDDIVLRGADAIDALRALLARGPAAVLTGAGCSTESGIPDYRGEGTRRRARNPVQHRAFLHEAEARQRYWARSTVGWPRFAAAVPNPAHHALAALEAQGCLTGIITQNVDGLHRAAGSRQVVELHGALANVRCLACGTRETRRALQVRLEQDNPGFLTRDDVMLADGDAELPEAATAGFRVPACLSCRGTLKPDVVFFGDSVPRDVVDAARGLLERAASLMVVGSSLAVYSGLRFVRWAHARGCPVAIVNLGPTRGDPLATLLVDGRAGVLLPALCLAVHGRPDEHGRPVVSLSRR
jgi:NAD-dependent SIR2 family protein deacetylase